MSLQGQQLFQTWRMDMFLLERLPNIDITNSNAVKLFSLFLFSDDLMMLTKCNIVNDNDAHNGTKHYIFAQWNSKFHTEYKYENEKNNECFIRYIKASIKHL